MCRYTAGMTLTMVPGTVASTTSATTCRLGRVGLFGYGQGRPGAPHRFLLLGDVRRRVGVPRPRRARPGRSAPLPAAERCPGACWAVWPRPAPPAHSAPFPLAERCP